MEMAFAWILAHPHTMHYKSRRWLDHETSLAGLAEPEKKEWVYGQIEVLTLVKQGYVQKRARRR